jgi:16S rRNA (adenine1518-N6/adenine1519-N6)-dimethyltransferase
MPAPRQTQSYLRGLFARRGIAPRRQLGQNFLVDLNIHELIVDRAEVRPGDVVLEVGSGAGALSALLAARGAAVIAVEVDAALAELTAAATAGLADVRVVHADALAGKHALNPEVLDHVRAGLAVAPGRRFKLVANLPFHVATPIVTNLLVHPELCPSLMVATIQLELAERMRAEAATSAYGALAVLVQALADVEVVRVLPPSVFWPRPTVDSAVVAIAPRADKRAAVGDLAWFHGLVRQVFLHRRQNLRRVLHDLGRGRWTKPEIDALLAGQGRTGLVRAEALTVANLIALARALPRRRGDDRPGDLPHDQPISS